MANKTLIFSIALNGYQWLYRNCIDSQRAYAKHYGYEYLVISRPYFTSLGVECCWLKLTVLLEALKAGYDTVLFVDADAYIKTSAHQLESLLQPDKYLYLAKSYSGRFNSGVILINNHLKIQQWLTDVISARHLTVLPEYDVGWGENGHIIEYTQNCEFVSTLDRRWNNTYDIHLSDYIRHFSFGPLRQNFLLNLSHKVLGRATRVLTKLQRYARTLHLLNSSQDPLIKLTKAALHTTKLFSKNNPT
ncbi:hypothetical protein CXF72_08700 [Psychromonas sp. MB-3u-54]|uniref:hypothetical protein n=1 Tax=Psychromonas sp. MB-3u-54 TaxID=2058319 RepID=UPI000C34DD4C|nr:hypothetical protein [Psychromonas sp. MB-3u-54]PKH02999.1 hypothetical protein CXF72_08700 [Psychromonas sp. MB-3u-54]